MIGGGKEELLKEFINKVFEYEYSELTEEESNGNNIYLSQEGKKHRGTYINYKNICYSLMKDRDLLELEKIPDFGEQYFPDLQKMLSEKILSEFKGELKKRKVYRTYLKTEYSEKFKIIFDIIYAYLEEMLKKHLEKIDNMHTYIEFIIRSYVSNTFGSNNSLEKVTSFLDDVYKYNMIENSEKFKHDYDIDNLDDFNIKGFLNAYGYNALLKFVNFRPIEEILGKIKKYQQSAANKTAHHKKKRNEGITGADKVFETPNVIIYQLLTEEGSKYYGNQTKWCTAANKDCAFKGYFASGNLYVIQSKHNPSDKFQLHVESNQLVNKFDSNVPFDYVIDTVSNKLGDPSLEGWFMQKMFPNGMENYTENVFSEIFPFKKELLANFPNLTSLNLISFNESSDVLKDLLVNFRNVENLEKLSLPTFDFPLNDSLNSLHSLKSLSLDSFNHPLGHSLSHLNGLQTLTLSSFNHPLGDSLSNLRELKSLSLSSFNHPLGDSLSNLRELKSLSLSSFNHPLGDSLSNLIELKSLGLGSFNHPFENSLSKLEKLDDVFINYFYDHPLDDSLQNIIRK